MAADFAFDTPPGHVEPVVAPAWPVLLSLACCVLALATVVVGRQDLHFTWPGYVLGALTTPAFAIIYRFCRRTACKSLYFVPRPALERLVLAVLALGILAGLANAWFMATELAKR